MSITRTTRAAAVVTIGAVALIGVSACSSDTKEEVKEATSAAKSDVKEATSEAKKEAKEKTSEVKSEAKDAKDKASKGVEINYWHRLPDKDKMIKVQQAADEFNKANPDITVKATKFEGDAVASYDKISAAIKAGNAPCLAQASYDGIPAMLVRGELMDVSKDVASYKDNYSAGAWGQVTLGGKTYGLPQDTGPLVYYYDKAAFEKLGLKVPTTWDEYWATAAKAKAAGKYTSAFFRDETGDWFHAVAAANNANWFGIKDGAWEVNMDKPETQAVAAAWQKSIDAGDTVVLDRWGDPSPTDTALKDGSLIGYIGAAWEAAFNLSGLGVDETQWQVAQLPGNLSGPWGGSAIVVLKGCKHPTEALKYADWYNTNIKAMVSQGLVPAAKGDVETPADIKKLYGGQDVMTELVKASDLSNPDFLFSPTWPAVKKTLIDNAAKDMKLADNIKAAQEEAVKSLKGKGLKVVE